MMTDRRKAERKAQELAESCGFRHMGTMQRYFWVENRYAVDGEIYELCQERSINKEDEKMIDSKPNIFEFATKELSQDAVFCYILDCFHDPEKKGIAQKFLYLIRVPDIDKIVQLDIYQQQDNIDIKVIVRYEGGSQKYVLIEDKVYSAIHDNQLMRYKEATLAREACRDEEIIGIFFKIGTPLPWEKLACKDARFTVLDYKEFLSFLESATEDPVLCAFYAFFKKRIEYVDKMDQCNFDALERREFDEVIGFRYGQRRLTEWIMKKIFPEDYCEQKMYDVNNFGSPCTQYEFIFDNETKASDWGLQESDLIRSQYCCFFRIDRNAKGWYISIRQYFRHGANDEESEQSTGKRNELLRMLGDDNAPNRKAKKEKNLLLYNIDYIERIKEILPKLQKATEYLIKTVSFMPHF